MSSSAITVRRLTGFEEADPIQWNRLLSEGGAKTVFLTWEWQKTWWDTFGRGDLLLLFAERNGRVEALAPFFLDGGMAFLVGSGGSDYLDFIGSAADPELLLALLGKVRELQPELVGIRLYHVPEDSPTSQALESIRQRLPDQVFREESLVAPYIDAATVPGALLAAANKHSLRRHEKTLQRAGATTIEHLSHQVPVPAMEDLFRLHIARWERTPYPSLFHDPQQRRFYLNLAQAGCRSGWVRYSRVLLDGRVVACHLGFLFGDCFLWYKPAFEIELAKYSPGEVLLRNLLLYVHGTGIRYFDFGLGDEPFKARFATGRRVVQTWGIYPTSRDKWRRS